MVGAVDFNGLGEGITACRVRKKCVEETKTETGIEADGEESVCIWCWITKTYIASS